MPNINKLSPKKKRKKLVKPTKKLPNLPTLKKTKLTKPSSVDYYNCLLTQSQNNWINPTTGKKQKITQCCSNCKTNAPVLNKQRELEIQKLVISYQQVGASLRKLLQPIK